MRSKLALLLLIFSFSACATAQKKPNEIGYAIDNKLASGEPVSIVVYVRSVENAFGYNAEWMRSITYELQSDIEYHLQQAFKGREGFKIVDRGMVENVLSELHFHMSGAVDANTAKELGRLTGASYLLVADFARLVGERGRPKDSADQRLIDIGTGELVAVALGPRGR